MQLNKFDLDFAIQKLPSNLKYVLKSADFDGKVVIAGGFLRGSIAKEKPTDIDIFVSDEATATSLAAQLQSDRSKHYVTVNAISLTIQGRSLQIIHRWTFPSAEDILNHFDFTIVQAAIWLHRETQFKHNEDKSVTASLEFTWQSLCSPEFYQDLAAKRLFYTNPSDAEPGGTLLRLLKYTRRGYSADLISLAQIVAKTAGVDAKAVYESLREVDPAYDPEVNKYAPEEVLKEAAEKPFQNVVDQFAADMFAPEAEQDLFVDIGDNEINSILDMSSDLNGGDGRS